MSQPTAESPRLPSTIPAEPTPRRKLVDPLDLAKRFLLGVIGSCCFSAIMFFVQVKAFIAFVLAAILTFLGWTTEPPKQIQEAGKAVLEKVGQEIKEHTPPLLGRHPTGGGMPASLVPLPGLGQKSPEQLKVEAERREAERLRREQSEVKSWLARAAAVKFDCDKDWPLEKLRVEVPIAEHQAAEEARKKPYLERADKIDLRVDPTVDFKTLRQQVEEAEKELAADADYQARLREWERAMEEYNDKLERGPNSRCPNCRHPLHFGKARIGGKFVCPKCTNIFTVRQAMAFWTPPPPPRKPTPPRKNHGFLWRVFH